MYQLNTKFQFLKIVCVSVTDIPVKVDYTLTFSLFCLLVFFFTSCVPQLISSNAHYKIITNCLQGIVKGSIFTSDRPKTPPCGGHIKHQ